MSKAAESGNPFADMQATIKVLDEMPPQPAITFMERQTYYEIKEIHRHYSRLWNFHWFYFNWELLVDKLRGKK